MRIIWRSILLVLVAASSPAAPLPALAQQDRQAQAPPSPSPYQVPTQDGGSRPVPDPTLLTTQALREAIASQRELFQTKIEALQAEIKKLSEVQGTGDSRVLLRLDNVSKQIDEQITHLTTLTQEKFKGVDQQFQGRDVALAAALLAQKTSVDEQNKSNALSSAKSEAATTKQIDGILAVVGANNRATDEKIDAVKILLSTQAKAVDDKITELRTSVGDIRSTTMSMRAGTTAQGESWATIISVVAIVITLALGLMHILSRQSKR